jgi:riboflavin synthase
VFTGLIEQVGKVAKIRRPDRGDVRASTRITVVAKLAARLQTGDSIAVSGVCLTALGIGKTQFSADLAQETLERTSLGGLKPGARVNLERPARAQDRLGGHVVQGHVDGTGKLVSLERIAGGEDWRLVVEIPGELARYAVPQGSIAIEGISLTVANVQGNRLEVAIIPHTYRATNLSTLRPLDPVNLEIDVLAKYAEKISRSETARRLTVAELIRQGF